MESILRWNLRQMARLELEYLCIGPEPPCSSSVGVAKKTVRVQRERKITVSS
jgi:hypothetical protein